MFGLTFHVSFDPTIYLQMLLNQISSDDKVKFDVNFSIKNINHKYFIRCALGYSNLSYSFMP